MCGRLGPQATKRYVSAAQETNHRAGLSFRPAGRWGIAPAVGNSACLVAEFAGAAYGSQATQLDVRGEVVLAHRLFVHERGAEVFLVVVAEDGDDGGVMRDFVLGAQSREEIAPGRDAHGKAKIGSQLLRHQDSVAVGNGDDLVELLELDDCRHEFVGDALDAVVADFAAGAQRGRFGGFNGMNADGGVALSQEFPDAHDRAARADSCDKGLRPLGNRNHLRPDFRAGGFFVRFDIGGVGELAREKNILACSGQLFAHADAAKESALLGTDGNHFSAVTANQLHALLAHPIGHENLNGVAQNAAEGGKRNTRVAAGSLGDSEAGLDLSLFIGLLQDAQGHAVLDAAGEVHVLGFGVENAFAALKVEVDADKGGITDEARQGFELRCGAIDEYGHNNSLSHVWRNSASASDTGKPARN